MLSIHPFSTSEEYDGRIHSGFLGFFANMAIQNRAMYSALVMKALSTAAGVTPAFN